MLDRDVHHFSSSSMNMSRSTYHQQQQQQSWSEHQRQQQQHYSTEFENEEVNEEEESNDDRHGAQLHQPLYPASEWDQKLDRMLDELQLSISPQRKPGSTRIEAGGGGSSNSNSNSKDMSSYTLTSGPRQQSTRQTVSYSSQNQSQEHHRTASGSRLYDTTFIASNPSVDNGAMSSIRDARSQSPEQHIGQKSAGPSYNEGPFNKGLSRGGSISSVRSHSSQQYSEYHSANKGQRNSSLLVGMPSTTLADDERFDDDFQATPSSVSDKTKAWSSRGVAYNFASETTSHNQQSGPATDGQVETVVKKTQVVKSSANGQQPLGYGSDEIDSALSDLMRVSQMATRSAQPETENMNVPAEESNRTGQSHHQQLTRSSSSSGPAVMQSGTTESSIFSSSSSSNTKQFYRYSSNTKTTESNEMPVHYATPDNRLKSSTSISSSSLSSAVHHAHVIDYSRISQKQIRAAGIQSLSHHQLNSPICNFPDHEDFPLYNLRIIPESAGLLCNVAKHPHPMCNVERHPNFPLYAASPPCPAGSQQTQPVCNIKVHPALLCNYARHPDYPAFTTGCLSTEKETVCNVPSHPISNFDNECRLSHPHDRSPLPSKCNIPGHPEYPDYMSLTEPQTEPFCDVPGHPFGLCNIQTHPQYPDMMGPEDREAAPYCFIPSHPELLCNIAHHPDYPGYMTEAEMPSEPICNVPRHPYMTQGVPKRNPSIPNQQDPFCSPYAVPTTIKPKMYQRGIGGSPLPTIRRPGIDPGLQSPPKKLDDLMDTFNGGPYQPYTSTPLVATDPMPFAAQVQATNGTAVLPKQTLFDETPKRPITNGASAPPVYYPPETNEMFAKTSPEAPLLMQQSQSHSMTIGGGAKGKMKYSAKYSAGASESDTKFKAGAGGAAVIPICLPVCCAMPCVIM